MTNKYFIHTNNLCILDVYKIHFCPDRLKRNYELQLYFSKYFSWEGLKSNTIVFNSMEDVLAYINSLNLNTLAYYQTNHPELFL